MPKAETLKIRLPARKKNVPSFHRPIQPFIESPITNDTRSVRSSQSNSNLTALVSSSTKPPAVLFPRRRPWNHAAELDYSWTKDWDDKRIIAYLFKNCFSIPARDATNPLITIAGRDGETTILPQRYRTPLLFTAKFQWESLRLVVSSKVRHREWEEYKYDILHVSRLCSKFLTDARNARGAEGIDKGWRSTMFDRALTRYYRRWFVNRPEFLKEFWCEFGGDEYQRDVLKKDWNRFALKGHKGFRITKDEIQTGISFEEFINGLCFIEECIVAEPMVTKRRDASNDVRRLKAPNGRVPMVEEPIQAIEEPMDVAQFLKVVDDTALPIAEDFDLGRLGLRSPLLPFSSRDSPPMLSASPSLQIKREAMEEAQVLFEHLHASNDLVEVPIVRRAQEDMAQNRVQGNPDHKITRIRDRDLSFRPHHSLSNDSLSIEKYTTSVTPGPKEISSDSAESVKVRGLSAAVQTPRTSPPDVEMRDDDLLVSASNQQNDVSNEPTVAALGVISSPEDTAPHSGCGQWEATLSVGNEFGFLGPSRGVHGESSTDVEMVVPSTDPACIPSHVTNKSTATMLAVAPRSNGWELRVNPPQRACKIDKMPRTDQGSAMTVILADVDISKSKTTFPSVTARTQKHRAGACGDTGETPAINNPANTHQDAMLTEASQGIEEIQSHFIHDPRFVDRAIHTHVMPASSHRCQQVSQAHIRTVDSSSVSRIVSLPRDTPAGLIEILEGSGQEEGGVATPHQSLQSIQPFSPLASSTSSPSIQPDALLVRELLDEIRGLKQQMKKNAYSRLEHNTGMERLRAQMDDLHRTIVYRDPLRQLSGSKVSRQGQKAPISFPSVCLPQDCTKSSSQHPLAHLFTMDTDIPQSNPYPPSSIDVDVEYRT